MFKKFFNKKDKNPKYILSKDDIKYTEYLASTIKELIKTVPTNNSFVLTNSSDTGLHEKKYLYNFESGYDSGLERYNGSISTSRSGITMSGSINELVVDSISIGGTQPYLITDSPIEDKETKKIIKPIDVVDELEHEVSPFSLEDLDAKIQILKDKVSLIKDNSYSKNETMGILERLENRKKWEQHSAFYNQFQNTSRKNIQQLLNKYDLAFKPSDIFIPEFPDIAISIMKAYEKETVKLCGKKPIFYVIAEVKDFKDKYDQRDPILLVQSPFGLYYQILGAWDKEMILLTEL